MKKYFIVSIAVAALFVGTMPLCAETGFNEMAKCVRSWGKGCGECGSTKAAAAPASSKKCCGMKTDTLGNKVPCGTNNSGKTRLGV